MRQQCSTSVVVQGGNLHARGPFGAPEHRSEMMVVETLAK